MTNHSAVISVADQRELDNFYHWLVKNRKHIIGISPNLGCGCCVVTFNLVVDEFADPLPITPAEEFASNTVQFGEARDLILQELLD